MTIVPVTPQHLPLKHPSVPWAGAWDTCSSVTSPEEKEKQAADLCPAGDSPRQGQLGAWLQPWGQTLPASPAPLPRGAAAPAPAIRSPAVGCPLINLAWD